MKEIAFLSIIENNGNLWWLQKGNPYLLLSISSGQSDIWKNFIMAGKLKKIVSSLGVGVKSPILSQEIRRTYTLHWVWYYKKKKKTQRQFKTGVSATIGIIFNNDEVRRIRDLFVVRSLVSIECKFPCW